MIADLHAHYPMHLVSGGEDLTLDQIVTREGRERLRDRVRAKLVGLAGRFANYESFTSGPRVTVPLMKQGGVGVALSVLYSPFDEMDLTRPYGSPPAPGYFDAVRRQLDLVELEIEKAHAGEATVAHSPEELDAALEAGTVALVHAVEGGFHLGSTPEEIEANVAELASRGVAYVTIAHLFWRGIATNAPAIPFIPDRLYRLLFPQPREGLSPLGRTAVRALVEQRVLVDVAHMSARCLEDTFSLVDALDPDEHVPVIASHAAYRFGRQTYNLSDDTVCRIGRRGGVVGLILAQHQATDGLRRGRTRSFEESFEVLCRHVDRIRDITGSHRHVAVGSDLDGFIKPTLAGLQDMGDLRRLGDELERRYGEDGRLIASGNALRVLRTCWRGRARV